MSRAEAHLLAPGVGVRSRNFGSILERKGDVMVVEVPADPANQTLAAANEAKASADNRLAKALAAQAAVAAAQAALSKAVG